MKPSSTVPKTPWTCLAMIIMLTGMLGMSALPAASSGNVASGEHESNCDIQHGPCLVEASDGMRIEFDIRPRPVKAMSGLFFFVTLTHKGKPVTDASVECDITMPGMYMGRNQPVLKHIKDGQYQGKGIITRCASGNTLWQARIIVVHGKQTDVAEYRFEVR